MTRPCSCFPDRAANSERVTAVRHAMRTPRRFRRKKGRGSAQAARQRDIQGAARPHRSILLTDCMCWNSRNLYDSDVMRRDMLTLVEQGGGAWRWYAVIARWAGYAGSRRCFIRSKLAPGSAKPSVGKTSRIARSTHFIRSAMHPTRGGCRLA
jgi:hypothetical protein